MRANSRALAGGSNASLIRRMVTLFVGIGSSAKKR